MTSSLDVWEYTPGEFSWQVDEDQSTWILAGAAEVELGDGQCLTLTAGMTMFLPRGMPTHWVIRETLRTVAARGC